MDASPQTEPGGGDSNMSLVGCRNLRQDMVLAKTSDPSHDNSVSISSDSNNNDASDADAVALVKAPKTSAQRVKENDPTLVKLYLTQQPSEYFDKEEPGDFENFLDALRRNTHISYVLFERHFVRNLPPADYAKVLQAVAQIVSLIELEIWSVRVPLATLCNAVAGASNLFRLGLGMVTLVEANGDCSALKHHPSLQYFYLSDFRFLQEEENKSLDSLWAALGTCPRLTNVEIYSKQSPERPWTASGLAHLASNTSLDQLTLRRLDLTSADILPFSNELRNNNSGMTSNLRTLNLNQNKFGDGGCVAIARAMSVCAVRELDLRENNLTDEGSVVVIPLLLQSLVLEKLNLASNPIQDEGARVLAEGLEQEQSRHLKHLDLSRAKISDVGCSRLAKALTINKSLLTLGLSYNNMTNATYLAFGEALETHNRTLLSLTLQCDRKRIAISGCQALLRCVEQNYVLETISTSLGASRGIDPRGDKANYAYYIRIYLRLNHAGRQKLLEQRGTKVDWINAIAAVQDSLHAIHYLISTNPSLCLRD